MKNYLLILLSLLLISCAQYKVVTRGVAGGMPARIVKLLSPQASSLNFQQNLIVPVKLQAFKFGTAVAKGRKVTFELLAGKAKLKNKSSITDNNGFAQVDLEIDSYDNSISLKYRIDNVIRTLDLYIAKPQKYIGEYSLSKSDFVSDKTVSVANGINIVNFKVQMKNSSNKSVDAYGLAVEITDGKQRVPMKELGDGVYEYNYKVGKEKGLYHFKVYVEDKKLDKEIEVQLQPDLEVVERFLIGSQAKDGEYEVQFAIKEKYGQFLDSLEGIDIRPDLKGEGTYSSIKYDKKNHRFKYTFYPPQSKGMTIPGIYFAGKSYWSKQSFTYDYVSVDASKTEVELGDTRIIPTGIDFFNINVKMKNANGQLVKITNQSQMPKVILSGKAKVLHFKANNEGVFVGKVVPAKLQKGLKVEVECDGKVVYEEDVTLSMKPLKDKMSLERKIGSGAYIDGLNSKIQDRGTDWKNITGRLVSFELENNGVNDIVPGGCTQDADEMNKCQTTREFEFEFQDQARQNMVLTITDLPSDKLSHMMHAHFYLFPRKVVPHFYWSEDKSQIHVVLPTDEEVIFDAETKRIIGGVMEEGPVDMGPSRHSRKFPLIRYKGKGIVLRINARGQDARLGNWNKTKISGDFGNIGAEGVMIYKYNSSTDQPDVCYAKKSEFWPQEDLSVIPFKYPSDKDFAAYLKTKCNMELELN